MTTLVIIIINGTQKILFKRYINQLTQNNATKNMYNQTIDLHVSQKGYSCSLQIRSLVVLANL